MNPNTARTEFVLGTFCTIDLFEEGNAAVYSRLFNRLAELDVIFSANRDDSELAQVNRSAGLLPVQVSPELHMVLDRAVFFANASGGAFDPSVGPLVKLWGIGTETPQLPLVSEIQTALELVNWQDVEVTNAAAGQVATGRASGATAYLKRQGMSLDLGGIAKGYAADELVRMLQEEGIPRALIDLGGNIYLWGNRKDGKPWYVGIQDPLGIRSDHPGFVTLQEGASVVSSGMYERFFTGDDGKRYHHILTLIEDEGIISPKGYPVENGLLSVTIIAASSMDADALSTACFALGYEKGLLLAAANNAEILFIFEDKTIRGSPGALEAFTLTDDSFRVNK